MRRFGQHALLLALPISLGLRAQTPPPTLTVPKVQIQVVGPTIVRLVAETAPGERVYDVAVRKQVDGAESDGLGGVLPLQGQSYKGTHWSGMATVRPGSIYRFQVMAESGTVSPANSAWSEEVIVRTPPPPSRPPAAPDRFAAKAISRYQVELRWRDTADNEYGFEVVVTEGSTAATIALVNPDATLFVVHGRLPGSTARYSIRSFNPAGASSATLPIAVTQPASLRDPVSLAADAPTIGACTTPEGAIREVEAEAENDEKLRPRTGAAIDRPASFEILQVPGSCGNANCDYHVYGIYGGCYRRLAELFSAGIELIGKGPADAPLMLDLGHMGGMRTNYTVSTIVNRRLTTLDSFVVCEPPDGDVTAQSPVFAECQFDQAIRPLSVR